MNDLQHVIPAAQYVRMSTDAQCFSIDNQKDSIQRYAAEHGFKIVATYADSGKSGLEIRHRSGLRNLLRDVLSGHAPFKIILVYDVSRWGRFQDVDESAYYEFLCKHAGIPVCYCAEQFSNDGTTSCAIMKALKRSMAAEYSRELGVKIYAGQKRLVLMGYRVNGKAGFGLRRLLISKDGRYKGYIKEGDRKRSATDRTILVPGSKREVDYLRRIFDLAAGGMTAVQIAHELNRRHVKSPSGGAWERSSLYNILHNEKYIGCNVWGKTSTRLSTRSRRLPKASWVTKPGAFAPVISQEVFNRVQKCIAERRRDRTTAEVLLVRVRKVLAKYGKVTQKLLKKHGGFDFRAYQRSFGSLFKAYELVGYHPTRRAVLGGARHRKKNTLRTRLINELRRLFPERLRVVRLPGQKREVLEVDKHVKVALHIASPLGFLSNGQPRWVLRVRPLEGDLPALICTVDPELDSFLGLYLTPPDFWHGFGKSRRLGKDERWIQVARKLNDLAEFCDAVCAFRGENKPRCIHRIGDVTISEHAPTIAVGNRTLRLGPVSSAIFNMLVLNAGRPMTRYQLSQGPPKIRPKNVDYRIYGLRKQLTPHGSRIHTVPRIGYLYCESRIPNEPVSKVCSVA